VGATAVDVASAIAAEPSRIVLIFMDEDPPCVCGADSGCTDEPAPYRNANGVFWKLNSVPLWINSVSRSQHMTKL